MQARDNIQEQPQPELSFPPMAISGAEFAAPLADAQDVAEIVEEPPAWTAAQRPVDEAPLISVNEQLAV